MGFEIAKLPPPLQLEGVHLTRCDHKKKTKPNPGAVTCHVMKVIKADESNQGKIFKFTTSKA